MQAARLSLRHARRGPVVGGGGTAGVWLLLSCLLRLLRLPCQSTPVEDVLRGQHADDREHFLAAPQVHARDQSLAAGRQGRGRRMRRSA